MPPIIYLLTLEHSAVDLQPPLTVVHDSFYFFCIFIGYAFLALLAAYIGIIIYQILKGIIHIRGLLQDKRTGELSPARVQLLMIITLVAVSILANSLGNSKELVLSIEEEWLWLLGGSQFIYLGGKSRYIWLSGITESSSHADKGDTK